jgi:hypothetical protein
MIDNLPTRRDFVTLAAYALALPSAADFFKSSEDYQPKFFDSEDFAALEAFTEILIPTDETPGAREARCAQFIDFVLASSDEATRKEWREAMRALREAGFHSSNASAREALVETISRAEREHVSPHPAYPAYRLIKRQNTFAFYTSRVGTIDVLEYRGNSYNKDFPACDHPEHHRV